VPSFHDLGNATVNCAKSSAPVAKSNTFKSGLNAVVSTCSKSEHGLVVLGYIAAAGTHIDSLPTVFMTALATVAPAVSRSTVPSAAIAIAPAVVAVPIVQASLRSKSSTRVTIPVAAIVIADVELVTPIVAASFKIKSSTNVTIPVAAIDMAEVDEVTPIVAASLSIKSSTKVTIPVDAIVMAVNGSSCRSRTNSFSITDNNIICKSCNTSYSCCSRYFYICIYIY